MANWPDCWPLDYLRPNSLANNRATPPATSTVAEPQPPSIADRAPAAPRYAAIPEAFVALRGTPSAAQHSLAMLAGSTRGQGSQGKHGRDRATQNDPLEGLPLQQDRTRHGFKVSRGCPDRLATSR